MGVSNRYLISTTRSDYDGLAQVAGAWAKSFDTAWGITTPTTMDLEATQEMSESVWQNRSPLYTTQNETPSTWTAECEAIIAAIRAAGDYLTSQGITPPTPGDSFVPMCRVQQDGETLQNIPSGVRTVIDWDSTAIDTDHMGGPTEITIKTAGVYAVSGQASYNMTEDPGTREISISINGSNTKIVKSSQATDGDSDLTLATDVGLVNLSVDDIVQLFALQISTGATATPFAGASLNVWKVGPFIDS